MQKGLRWDIGADMVDIYPTGADGEDGADVAEICVIPRVGPKFTDADTLHLSLTREDAQEMSDALAAIVRGEDLHAFHAEASWRKDNES